MSLNFYVVTDTTLNEDVQANLHRVVVRKTPKSYFLLFLPHTRPYIIYPPSLLILVGGFVVKIWALLNSCTVVAYGEFYFGVPEKCSHYEKT